jgi:hypothetical protein
VWLLYSLLIMDCCLDSSSLKFFDCFFDPSSLDSSILPPRILLRPNFLASINSAPTMVVASSPVVELQYNIRVAHNRKNQLDGLPCSDATVLMHAFSSSATDSLQPLGPVARLSARFINQTHRFYRSNWSVNQARHRFVNFDSPN